MRGYAHVGMPGALFILERSPPRDPRGGSRRASVRRWVCVHGAFVRLLFCFSLVSCRCRRPAPLRRARTTTQRHRRSSCSAPSSSLRSWRPLRARWLHQSLRRKGRLARERYGHVNVGTKRSACVASQRPETVLRAFPPLLRGRELF